MELCLIIRNGEKLCRNFGPIHLTPCHYRGNIHIQICEETAPLESYYSHFGFKLEELSNIGIGTGDRFINLLIPQNLN